MTSQAGIIDELERDLGPGARARVLLNAGGQRRYIPKPNKVQNSELSRELGPDVAVWLSGRFGGELVTFPSRNGAAQDDQASRLRAAVLEAGLTDPTRSANDIAAEFGVTARRVYMVRAEMAGDHGRDDRQMDLFGE